MSMCAKSPGPMRKLSNGARTAPRPAQPVRMSLRHVTTLATRPMTLPDMEWHANETRDTRAQSALYAQFPPAGPVPRPWNPALTDSRETA